jgi:beta-lactam-binding protein with PASTA domain/tRNA A-37 threonylcarbamoyl transferase component Bud32
MDDTLADPITGRLIDGRYAVSARIAHGGMATVYLAMDTRLDRQVALKVMHAELARDDDFVRRFIDEAKSVARLSHQNVVAVYDQGADGPFLYLAMEYVPGRTLKDMLRERGRFTPAAALDIMSGVLAGLAAAHASGIVHRDVKPENVLITAGGQVKVADFGLARAHAAAGHTRSGMIIGTVAYLAPEQVTASVPVGPRSDVYSAGVLMYELLTGRQPFAGETPIAVAYQHVNSDVPAPSSLLPGIPQAVDQLVLDATDRDPARRPADAAQFLRTVRPVADELSLVSPVPGLAAASGQTGEHSGLTGRLGIGVQGLSEAPWLDLDNPASTSGGRSGGRHAASALPPGGNGYDTGAFGPAEFSGANHTLIVRREEAEPYPAGREPFLGRWLFSRRLIYVGLAVAVLAGAGVGGWWLTSGQYTTIPPVTSDTVSAATAVLTARGFQISGDLSENSNTVTKGLVVGTSPAGRASKGAKIAILVSAGPFTSVMPAVRGEQQAAAVDALKKVHLTAAVQLVGSDAAVGTVVGSTPKAGTAWQQTKPVTLLVAGGPPLPDFKGMQEAAAKQLAQTKGVTLNAVLNNNSTQPQGTILSQSPGPNSILHPGESVMITVSSGPQLVPVPDVIGQTLGAAEQQLRAAGFKIQVDNNDLFGQVWNYAPVTPAPFGSTISLNVFPFGNNGNNGNGNGNGNGGGGLFG